jgi:hypothetical protein
MSSPLLQSLVCAYQRILELAVPRQFLAARPGGSFHLCLSLYQAEELLERYPTQGFFRVPVPPVDFEAHAWSV